MVTVWRTVLLLSCYDCDIIHQHYDVTRLNTYCDIAQYMNVLWIFITKTWIAQGRFINMIRTPSKQWGMCDKSRRLHTHTHTHIYIYIRQVRIWRRHELSFLVTLIIHVCISHSDETLHSKDELYQYTECFGIRYYFSRLYMHDAKYMKTDGGYINFHVDMIRKNTRKIVYTYCINVMS